MRASRKALVGSLHILAVVAAGLARTSCSNPETDFQKAEQANTEQAYERFLQRHPDSPLAAKARSNLAKVSYENAKRTNTVVALEFFLSRFPSSELSTNASTDLENLEFELAGCANTESAWSGFLKKYTNSSHMAVGREGFGKCVFARVSQENTMAGYESFLTNHADCTLIPQAREKLASLLLTDALKADTPSTYEAVARRFPDTKAGGEARKGWAKLDYDACVKEHTIAAYEQFLSRHGDSERFQDVKARLEAQLEERDWSQALLKNVPAAYLDYYSRHKNSTRLKEESDTIMYAAETIRELVLRAVGRSDYGEIRPTVGNPVEIRFLNEPAGEKEKSTFTRGSEGIQVEASVGGSSLQMAMANPAGSAGDGFYTRVSNPEWLITSGHLTFDGRLKCKGHEVAFTSGAITTTSKSEPPQFEDGASCMLDGTWYSCSGGKWFPKGPPAKSND